jgi:indole-3-glycerol phosphate synthase
MLLDDIVRHKKQEVELLKQRLDIKSAVRATRSVAPTLSFEQAFPEHKLSLIAEVKKASPSAGVIIPDYDPVELAQDYEEAGASAVSVLTDEKYFRGSLKDLEAVEHEINIPVLRKDFIIDEAQIYESRLAGADAVLLIVRILAEKELKAFIALTKELQMAALVEVHTEEELNKALAAEAQLIGINNRDLDTLKIDLDTTFSIMGKYPALKQKLVISESGINSHQQVKALRAAGVRGILVGEGLLLSGNVAAKIKEMMRE